MTSGKRLKKNNKHERSRMPLKLLNSSYIYIYILAHLTSSHLTEANLIHIARLHKIPVNFNTFF